MEALTAFSTLLLAFATFTLCGITVWVATKDRRPHLLIDTTFHEIREGKFQKQIILTITNDCQLAVTVIAAYWRNEGFEKPIVWQRIIQPENGKASSSQIHKWTDIKILAGDVAHFDLVTDSVSANGSFLNGMKPQIVVRISTGKEFCVDLPTGVYRNLQT